MSGDSLSRQNEKYLLKRVLLFYEETPGSAEPKHVVYLHNLRINDVVCKVCVCVCLTVVIMTVCVTHFVYFPWPPLEAGLSISKRGTLTELM
jgi:hypothetical protein